MKRRMKCRELTILGRERQPRLHETKTAINEIKDVKLWLFGLWLGALWNL